jgi:hypothetical protein
MGLGLYIETENIQDQDDSAGNVKSVQDGTGGNRGTMAICAGSCTFFVFGRPLDT